jgi:photosystem II stability/assembly factor-like uncharacterized protein
VPTEHWLDPRAERRNKPERKRWLAEMHRAAPGTDWKAIERENGLRLMELRERLALAKDYTADTWTERGSRNLAGRMHAVALGLDGVTLYGGSSRGGTWRTTTDGADWTPLGDNLYGGAHQLAVGAGPAEVLVALTNWGRVRHSLDQGDTWLEPAGLPGDVNWGRRLLADASDPALLYALIGRPGDRREVHVSTDGGLSWALIQVLASRAGDIWMDRVTGGRLWLIDGAEVSYTDNQGLAWTNVAGVAGGAVEDARLAGSEAGAPTLYAALRIDGSWELHRSDDAGGAWSFASPIPDFWGSLSASITDPMLVATGGVETFRSEDGGVTPVLVNAWGEYYGNPAGRLHADVPGLQTLLVEGRERWFISTDGGLYISDDGLLTVSNISLEGLGVSQYYSTLTSKRDPGLVIAGAQDQGYQRSRGADAGPGLYDFDQLISGDYAHLTSSDRTHDWVYSVYPGFILVQQGEERPDLSTLDFPAGAALLWLPPVVADPTNKTAFYLCSDQLWRYERGPGGWSSFLETTQDFTVGGGWTLSALSISHVDPQRRIAVTTEGVFWYSSDGGFNWTQSLDVGPNSHYFHGTALAHSPDDALIAYAGGSGYSGPGVYRTVDGGELWEPVGDGLPGTLVYDLAWEGPGSSIVFAATEAGPYRLDPGTDTWEYLGGSVAPLTTYWTVEAIPEIGVIRFGTYGRGIWDWQAVVVPETGRCDDGVDNEGDGLIDCADEECVGTDPCLEDCTSREDEDLDGLVDCEDPDCVGQPGCLEDCSNGVDDDLDGDVDCDDADCFVFDTDGDGYADCDECAPWDPGAFAVPREVETLLVEKSTPDGSTVRLSWSDSAAVASGTGAVHDVVGGTLSTLRANGWPASAPCLGDDLAGTEHEDLRPDVVDGWYLVRAVSACGWGPWGSAGDGLRRPSPACP